MLSCQLVRIFFPFVLCIPSKHRREKKRRCKGRRPRGWRPPDSRHKGTSTPNSSSWRLPTRSSASRPQLAAALIFFHLDGLFTITQFIAVMHERRTDPTSFFVNTAEKGTFELAPFHEFREQIILGLVGSSRKMARTQRRFSRNPQCQTACQLNERS